jgi:hypothetical protein
MPLPPQPVIAVVIFPAAGDAVQVKAVPVATPEPDGTQDKVPVPRPAVAVESVKVLAVNTGVTVEVADNVNEQGFVVQDEAEPVPETLENE